MIINVDEFLCKYTTEEWYVGKFIPAAIHARLVCSATAFIELPDNIESTMLMKKEEYMERDNDYAEISYYRNLGLECEKEDGYNQALSYYIDSIHKGESSRFDMFHAYRMSYDRAIALARLLHIEYLERELIEGLMKHSITLSDKIRLSERLTALSA